MSYIAIEVCQGHGVTDAAPTTFILLMADIYLPRMKTAERKCNQFIAVKFQVEGRMTYGRVIYHKKSANFHISLFVQSNSTAQNQNCDSASIICSVVYTEDNFSDRIFQGSSEVVSRKMEMR